RTMVENVLLRAGLLHHFSGERNRAGGSQGYASAFETRPGGPVHIVELAGMGMNVVNTFAAGEMEVAAAAVEGDVALGSHATGRGIVGCGIGAKVIIAEMNGNVAAQSVDVPGPLAFIGIDDDRVLFAHRQVLLLRVCLGVG